MRCTITKPHPSFQNPQSRLSPYTLFNNTGPDMATDRQDTNSEFPVSIAISLGVLLLVVLCIGSMFLYKGIADRRRISRTNNQEQQLPVYRMDPTHGDTSGTTHTDPRDPDPHSQTSGKTKTYRERILEAMSRREQPPSYGSSSRFNDISLQEIPLRHDKTDGRD